MERRDGLDQGKPKPRTWQGAGWIGTEETLSCPGAVHGCQAWPFIADADFALTARRRTGAQANGPAFRGEFYGIVQKIGDGLQQHVAIPNHLQLFWPGSLQLLAAFFGKRAIDFRRIGQHCRQIEACEGSAPRPGLSLRNAEQRLKDAADAIQISHGGFHRRAQALFIRCAQQGIFKPHPRARDRRAQIMRDGIRNTLDAHHELINAIQHSVHAGAQLIEFIALRRKRHTAGKIPGGNGACGQ